MRLRGDRAVANKHKKQVLERFISRRFCKWCCIFDTLLIQKACNHSVQTCWDWSHVCLLAMHVGPGRYLML